MCLANGACNAHLGGSALRHPTVDDPAPRPSFVDKSSASTRGFPVTKLVQLEGPEGACYVDLTEVVFVGHEYAHPVTRGRDLTSIAVRTVGLRGGVTFLVVDGPKNMVALLLEPR